MTATLAQALTSTSEDMRIDHQDRVRLTVGGSVVALPGNESVQLDLNLSKFASHEIRSLIAKACEVLHMRDEYPPEGVLHRPRVAPTFLTLPREIRDQIYERCGLTPAIDFRQEPNNCSILRMTNNGLEAVGSTAGRNTRSIIVYKCRKAVQVHQLSFACRQIFNETIADIFANNALNIKLDISNTSSLITEAFWAEHLPYWLLKGVRKLHFEVRGSVENWARIREQLCCRLRKLHPAAHIWFRFYIDFPSEQADLFLAEVPSCLRSSSYHEGNVLDAWHEAQIEQLTLEHSHLTAMYNVSHVQLLYLGRRGDVEFRKEHRSTDVDHAVVFNHEPSGWERTRLTWSTLGDRPSHHVDIVDGVIQDL